MGVGDTFHFFNYHSDNGTTYVVKLSDMVAAAGGFGSPVAPLSGPAWPYKTKDLRHVNGATSDKLHRDKIPVASNTDALFQTGGSWLGQGGRTYIVSGSEGERRPASHIH